MNDLDARLQRLAAEAWVRAAHAYPGELVGVAEQLPPADAGEVHGGLVAGVEQQHPIAGPFHQRPVVHGDVHHPQQREHERVRVHAAVVGDGDGKIRRLGRDADDGGRAVEVLRQVRERDGGGQLGLRRPAAERTVRGDLTTEPQ